MEFPIVISDTGEYNMMLISEFVEKNIKNIVIVAVIILIIIGIIGIRKFLQKKQKEKELKQAAEDKLRDENLNNVILNNHSDIKRLRKVHIPYDVDYSTSKGTNDKNLNDGIGKESHIMLQLIERTELSTRKFMLNPMLKIRIGSDLQDNDIAVLSEGISPHQCEIFSVGEKIYIKSISHDNQTILKRKKEQVIVDKRGIRLISNDKIILGNVVYEVMIKN